MSDHDLAERYDAAIRELGHYVRRNQDGTLRLDIEDQVAAKIDPVVLADLRRSLEETNKLIRSGAVNPLDIHIEGK